MVDKPILGVAEARASLTHLIRSMAGNPSHEPVVIGSHRTPQAVLAPYMDGTSQNKPRLDLLVSKLPLIKTLALAHRLSTVSVIGSVARGDSRHDSDVDLLCDTLPNTTLFDVMAFEEQMEMALGYPVTALTRNSLRETDDSSFVDDAIRLC
jgi:predicted nucleotidyltransferase